VRRKIIAASVLVWFVPLSASAGVKVEQIESYEVDSGDNANDPTRYALVDFAGATSVTLQAGQEGGYFAGITFHALGGTTATNSEHAYGVGESFYGDASAAYPFVTDVYAAPDTLVLQTTAGPRTAVGIAPAPGTFQPGVAIINNSYVYTTGSAASDLDLQRRLDFMIAQSDATFVTAAVSEVGTTSYAAPWSSFNSLAVAGNEQTFSVTGAQGKLHADLSVAGEASFSSADVAGFAAALYGTAQVAGQSDALHGVAIRSLLMAGADKSGYSRDTANNLSVSEGAGVADYNSSLTILNAGEKPLVTVGSGGAIAGTPSSDQRGWAYGTVAANSEDVVLFNVALPLTGVTASLNWDVTSLQPAAGEINTSNAGLQFADLNLEVRPVTQLGSSYVLGASLSDATYRSDATGDNVQYLYSTDSLPAGTYAFVITGDAKLSPAVGFSYSLSGTFPDVFAASGGGSWATASNWAAGVPNTAAAQVSLSGATGVTAATVTLDGSKTIGQLFLSGATNYTISTGTGGTLTFDDTGDATVNPQINVSSGSHTISALAALANGLNITIAASSSLEISGAITGSGGIKKTGAGTLTLDGVDNFGSTTINAGTVVLSNSANLTSGTITVNSTGTLLIPASSGTGIFLHALGSAISLASGGTASVAEPVAHANRQLIVSPNITFAGTANNWAGEFSLGDNDLDLTDASLANITNQIKQGLAAGATQGIISSDVASDTTHLTTLGVIVNNNGSGAALYGNSTTLGLFDTSAPGVNDVLVKYTYVGDANLDGSVNSSDFSLIDAGYTGHLTGWYNGDFNYDGVVDGSDFTLIDNVYPSSNATPLATVASQFAGSSSVPEPVGLILIAASAAFLLSGRRRGRTPARRGANGMD
jgi:autotransporter-associated beta strand protein